MTGSNQLEIPIPSVGGEDFHAPKIGSADHHRKGASLNTKVRNLLALVGLGIGGAACGEVIATKTPDVGLTPTPITQTLDVATITPTFTETKTPTITMIPSETAIPRPVYREEFPNSPDDFTLTTEEGKKTIIQDIIDHPTLPEPQETYWPKPISVFSDQDLIYLHIDCKMGVTCAWRGFLREADPVNGPDQLFGELEVRNKGDKKSHVVDLYLDDDEKNPLQRLQHELDVLHINTSKGDVAFIIPILSRHLVRWDNPVLAEMIDGITPARRKQLETIQKTLEIFDSISDAPLWLGKTDAAF